MINIESFQAIKIGFHCIIRFPLAIETESRVPVNGVYLWARQV